jgi:hypothetical protein
MVWERLADGERLAELDDTPGVRVTAPSEGVLFQSAGHLEPVPRRKVNVSVFPLIAGSRMAKRSCRRRDVMAALILLGALLPQLALLPPSAHAQMGIATTSVSCSPSPVAVGSPTTCTATATGIVNTPTGTVTWSSGGAGAFSPASLTCTLSSGACSVSYTPSSSTPSPVTITAIYGGDANNDGSTGTFSLAVGLASTPSTSSTAPEFPTASIAVIMLVVMATVALVSRRPRTKLG